MVSLSCIATVVATITICVKEVSDDFPAASAFRRSLANSGLRACVRANVVFNIGRAVLLVSDVDVVTAVL